MTRFSGFVLCTLGVISHVAAALSFLSLKSLVFSPSAGAPGELLVGVGALALAIVLALVGAKTLKAGRAKLSSNASAHA